MRICTLVGDLVEGVHEFFEVVLDRLVGAIVVVALGFGALVLAILEEVVSMTFLYRGVSSQPLKFPHSSLTTRRRVGVGLDKNMYNLPWSCMSMMNLRGCLSRKNIGVPCLWSICMGTLLVAAC
jgi:hypothetical protein